MRDVFLLSLRLHARWLLGALGPRGRRVAPLGGRRLLVLALLYPAFLALQALHWLGFLLDELLFPGYRRVAVREPLFVTGIPRSGTTFVHRALAADREAFTTFRTWEALLAPSVSERRLLQGLGALDRLLGRPLGRLADALTARLAGGLAHIHPVGLWAAEEDYLALLPAGGCFIMVLAFPADPHLWRLGRLQDLPARERGLLLGFYHACLQKHLYAVGGQRRLLSKNASFGSWLPELAARYPDARFLVCVREPGGALRSQLSSLRPGLALFATRAAAPAVQAGLEDNLGRAYERLREAQGDLPGRRLAVVDQGRLRRDAPGELGRALGQLGVAVSGPVAEVLEASRAEPAPGGGHRHVPLAETGAAPEPGARTVRAHQEILAGIAHQAGGGRE